MVENALAGVAVRDLDVAVEWYERLLEQPPTRPMPEVAEWRFRRGGCLQVFVDDGRAGRSSVTLAVASLRDQLAAMASAGIQAGQPTRTESVDTAIVEDPDGNQVVVAEAHTDELAR
jgi:hypothetical protein